VRPGSLVFLLSDFAGIDREDGTWLARLGRGSEVVMIHVHDPLEASVPPSGRYPAADEQRRGLLDTSDSSLRARWQGRFEQHVDRLKELARRHAVHRIALRTDQPVGDTLRLGLHPRRRLPAGMP
jgi:hypothetical protein